jgi:hypothetical protein
MALMSDEKARANEKSPTPYLVLSSSLIPPEAA